MRLPILATIATAIPLPLSAALQSIASWQRMLLGDEAATSGAFVCEDTIQNGRWSGVCFHPTLAAVRSAEARAERGAAYRANVCRLLRADRLVTPNGALEVSASGVIAEGAALPDSVTVYRLLYVPNATESSLGVPDEDPGDGRPWLHQAGTCTAHIMWSEVRTMR